jgi:ATP-dependent protease ClpP protease subunit
MTTLEIDILGPIGHGYNQDPSKDFTSESVASALASKPAAVKLRINSPGGDCFDALATYNLLRSSGAKVEVEVLGLAASAASLIAMAGDSVLMATGSMMMLHNPWTAAVGNSNDLREAADRLDKVRQSFLDIYQSKSGRAAEEVGAVMDDETWLTADEAVEFGFATGKLGEQQAQPLPAITLAKIHAKSWEPLKAAAMVLEVPPAVEEPAPTVEAQETLPSPIEAILAQVGAESIESIQAALKLAPEVLELRAQLDLASASLQESHAKATAAEAQAADLRAKLEQKERDGIVAGLRAKGQITPALESALLPKLDIDGLRAFAVAAPRVVPQSGALEAASQGSDGRERYLGKTFAELAPDELTRLHTDDVALYRRMRTQAGR